MLTRASRPGHYVTFQILGPFVLSQLVFVYGSLKRGGCYHPLIQHARYVGPHRCAPRYTMLDLGRYPGVIEKGETAVQGEVYSVDEPTLARLDQLEDCPDIYTRQLIDTAYGRAWMYLYRAARGDEAVVTSGDWPVAGQNS